MAEEQKTNQTASAANQSTRNSIIDLNIRSAEFLAQNQRQSTEYSTPGLILQNIYSKQQEPLTQRGRHKRSSSGGSQNKEVQDAYTY